MSSVLKGLSCLGAERWASADAMKLELEMGDWKVCEGETLK